MFKIYDAEKCEEKQLFDILKKRSEESVEGIEEKVKAIIEAVKKRGDEAVGEYTKEFDGVLLSDFILPEEVLDKYAAQTSKELYETMERAADNIRKYHEKQLSDGYTMEENGKILGRVVRPLKRVGVYVPGGTAAYPSTVLMNCIPAVVAGVEEIILVTPIKESGMNPAVAAAAKIAGIKKVCTIGGAQAIAALTYGTETIPMVDKIVGPGNAFVAEAKKQVFGKVDIDMIAGPSEVLVIADESANPEYVAADLLSQLEHDVLASAVLITTSKKLAEDVRKHISCQIEKLSRKEIAEKSLSGYSGAVIVKNLKDAVAMANRVAPEHLEIITEDPFQLLEGIENAGSVFLGSYCPEPLGDYFAGTNHVLPTNGTARFSSPLSVDDFVKKMSYLSYNEEAFLREAEDVKRFAEAEGLTAHGNAIRVRQK